MTLLEILASDKNFTLDKIYFEKFDNSIQSDPNFTEMTKTYLFADFLAKDVESVCWCIFNGKVPNLTLDNFVECIEIGNLFLTEGKEKNKIHDFLTECSKQAEKIVSGIKPSELYSKIVKPRLDKKGFIWM
jgi:hypothetical protein